MWGLFCNRRQCILTPHHGSSLLHTIVFKSYVLTINVPVVYMARYVMVLRHATSLRGTLEGAGPENRDCSLPFRGPKKLRFSGPTPYNAPSKDVPRLKKCHINNRYVGNFMYKSVVALLCVVLFRYIGILSAVLCGGRGGGCGLQSSPSPSHHTVGTQGWILMILIPCEFLIPGNGSTL
jgi:hypothetical protein